MEIKPREMAFSVAIVFVMLALGFLIGSKIGDHIAEENDSNITLSYGKVYNRLWFCVRIKPVVVCNHMIFDLRMYTANHICVHSFVIMPHKSAVIDCIALLVRCNGKLIRRE